MSAERKGGPVGLEAYARPDLGDDRTDKFELSEENPLFHFPCNCCIHRRDGQAFCQGCRHYVL